VEDGRRAAEEAVLLDLVSLLDDLERAVQAASDMGANPSWSEGVALVLQKGREYLERQGVTAVDPAGEPFDPNFHEAILEVDAPPGVAAGAVVQVVNKGYRRGARALRPARVVVARGSSDEA
jgi:molecular chaperone GrpE